MWQMVTKSDCRFWGKEEASAHRLGPNPWIRACTVIPVSFLQKQRKCCEVKCSEETGLWALPRRSLCSLASVLIRIPASPHYKNGIDSWLHWRPREWNLPAVTVFLPSALSLLKTPQNILHVHCVYLYLWYEILTPPPKRFHLDFKKFRVCSLLNQLYIDEQQFYTKTLLAWDWPHARWPANQYFAFFFSTGNTTSPDLNPETGLQSPCIPLHV